MYRRYCLYCSSSVSGQLPGIEVPVVGLVVAKGLDTTDSKTAEALAKASDEQLQSCAATLQKKAGDHVYLDTVGVAAAFATMTRMVDGTGHSANLMATTMAKHVTNSVVQVKRSLRRRWLLVLLGGILAGVAAKKLAAQM